MKYKRNKLIHTIDISNRLKLVFSGDPKKDAHSKHGQRRGVNKQTINSWAPSSWTKKGRGNKRQRNHTRKTKKLNKKIYLEIFIHYVCYSGVRRLYLVPSLCIYATQSSSLLEPFHLIPVSVVILVNLPISEFGCLKVGQFQKLLRFIIFTRI